MRMNRLMYWRFEAIGNPDQAEEGYGSMIAAYKAVGEWLIRTHVQDKIRLTFAKSKDQLVDKRMVNGGNNTVDDVLDEVFAGMNFDEGID